MWRGTEDILIIFPPDVVSKVTFLHLTCIEINIKYSIERMKAMKTIKTRSVGCSVVSDTGSGQFIVKFSLSFSLSLLFEMTSPSQPTMTSILYADVHYSQPTTFPGRRDQSPCFLSPKHTTPINMPLPSKLYQLVASFHICSKEECGQGRMENPLPISSTSFHSRMWLGICGQMHIAIKYCRIYPLVSFIRWLTSTAVTNKKCTKNNPHVMSVYFSCNVHNKGRWM